MGGEGGWVGGRDGEVGGREGRRERDRVKEGLVGSRIMGD